MRNFTLFPILLLFIQPIFMASRILDLPEPFFPMIRFMPGSKEKECLLNSLKFEMSALIKAMYDYNLMGIITYKESSSLVEFIVQLESSP